MTTRERAGRREDTQCGRRAPEETAAATSGGARAREGAGEDVRLSAQMMCTESVSILGKAESPAIREAATQPPPPATGTIGTLIIRHFYPRRGSFGSRVMAMPT